MGFMALISPIRVLFLHQLVALARIQRIVQPVTKEGEGDQDQPNRNGGGDHQMGEGAPHAQALGQHAAPTGIGRLDADAEKA